ncbi:cell division topological specificity factor (chloroplast) [Galdieria partita]|uniref:Putative cell division topological specificity factor n=1 Tax=Galdieria partita TaxID=83374 RepID=A0A9C7F5F1_9RHOD|nr:cell division topological specificity factor [Galdieria partita]
MFTKFFIKLLKKDYEESRYNVKKRLKSILAHDRLAINSNILEKMHMEILNVVSKYVELDPKKIEFSVETDNKIKTISLIANISIKRIIYLDKV